MRGMARIHDDLIMLLMVGRNHILILVVQLLRCYFCTLQCFFCTLWCFFQCVLLLLWFRWINFPLSFFIPSCWLCTWMFIPWSTWIWYSLVWRKFIPYLFTFLFSNFLFWDLAWSCTFSHENAWSYMVCWVSLHDIGHFLMQNPTPILGVLVVWPSIFRHRLGHILAWKGISSQGILHIFTQNSIYYWSSWKKWGASTPVFGDQFLVILVPIGFT